MGQPAFQELNTRGRKAFLKRNRGFLTAVQRRLERRGTRKSVSTLSRTWMGGYQKPAREVIGELQAEYLRVLAAENAKGGTTKGRSKPPNLSGDGDDAPNREQQSAQAEAELRWQTEIAKREEWVRKRQEKHAKEQAWLRSKQEAREHGETWLRERLRQQREVQERVPPEHRELPAALADFYLTPREVAQILAVSEELVRRLFGSEPDVLRLGPQNGRRSKLRIPLKVLERVIRRNLVPWPSSRY